jgi:hypothetical protein
MAPRDAKCTMRWTCWAGQSAFVQNVSASPASLVSGSPHAGQARGNAQAGLPFLNGGAILGFVVAYVAFFHSFGLGITWPPF